MLIKQKKIQILLASLLIILCAFAASPLSAHAQETTTEPENIGVSAICPDKAEGSEEPQIQPNSASRPTKVWNLATKGKYNFKGTIKNAGTTLYTNYKFKWKTKYTFVGKNTGNSILTVKAKRKAHTYATETIKAGKTRTVSFSNIKAATEFYLAFDGSSFSGYIK